MLDNDQYRDVHRAIFDCLWRSGAEIITDIDRHDADLPPRGNNGWTNEHLRILEMKRTEALLGPIPPIILKEKEQ